MELIRVGLVYLRSSVGSLSYYIPSLRLVCRSVGLSVCRSVLTMILILWYSVTLYSPVCARTTAAHLSIHPSLNPSARILDPRDRRGLRVRTERFHLKHVDLFCGCYCGLFLFLRSHRRKEITCSILSRPSCQTKCR